MYNSIDIYVKELKSGNDLSEEGTVKEGWRYYTEN